MNKKKKKKKRKKKKDMYMAYLLSAYGRRAILIESNDAGLAVIIHLAITIKTMQREESKERIENEKEKKEKERREKEREYYLLY